MALGPSRTREFITVRQRGACVYSRCFPSDLLLFLFLFLEGGRGKSLPRPSVATGALVEYCREQK